MCNCKKTPPIIFTPEPDTPCCGGTLGLTDGQTTALAAAALVCDRPLAGLPSVSFTPSPTPGGPTAPRICKSVIPPWAGHHGGISACFDGRGNVTAFVEHPERPGVVDPF